MNASKPPIIVNDTSARFWAAAKEHRLLLQYDAQAGRYQFYPRPLSLHGQGALEWREASGTGVLVAFTETHFPAPGFDLPYLEGLIQLDEGPRIFAPIAGITYADLRVGQRMRIAWPEPGSADHPFHFQPLQEHA